MRAIRIALCFAALATTAQAPAPAPAGPTSLAVTPDGAARLASSLNAWVDQMAGPAIPNLPIEATVEGDHYRVALPLIGLRTPQAAPQLSASVQPEPDGNWRLDDLQLPPQFTIPTKAGQTDVTIGHQQTSGLVDPLLRGPSILRSDMADIHVTAVANGQTTEQRIDQAQIEAKLVSGPNRLLDLTETSTINGLRSGAIGGTTPVATGTGVRHGEANLRLTGIDPDHVRPAVQALTALFLAMPAPAATATQNQISPQMRAALLHLLTAVDGLAGSLHLQESLDDMQIELANIGNAAIDRSRFGLGVETASGLLRAWLEMGLDGLTIGGVPPELASLVPQHVSLRPSISGVPVDALRKLLTDEAERDPPPQPDIDALFAQGSLIVAIDALTVAIGPAEFEGAGSMLLLSPGEQEGQARISATGFDRLMQQVTQNPDLAQVTPFFILARGLATPDGDHLVWTINASRDGHVTVNGTDLTAMMGSRGKQPSLR